MKRYAINMTAMQWGLIAVDIGRTNELSESTVALKNLIRLALEHTEKPDDIELPFNISEC